MCLGRLNDAGATMIFADSHAPTLVVLSGDLDLYEAPRVRDALDALDGPGVVDMSAVRLVDSSVLNELARVAKRAGLQRVTLIVKSPNIRRVLDVVQFERLFHIAADPSAEVATE